jgi:hypothetical protein
MLGNCLEGTLGVWIFAFVLIWSLCLLEICWRDIVEVYGMLNAFFFVYYYNLDCESFRVCLPLRDTFRGRLSTRIYSVRALSAILAMADRLSAI